MADPQTLAKALTSIKSDPYSSRGDPYGGLEPNPDHTISSYTPNMRENLSGIISDIFGNRRGVDRVLNRMDAIGLNPAGWLDSARDAGRFIGEAVQSNNLNDAAGNIGLGTLAAVGAIPGLPGKKAAVGGPDGKVLGANVVSGPTQRAIELARALRGKAGAPVLHDAPFSNYKIPPDRLEAYAERNVVEPAVGYVPERQISPEALSGDGFLLNFVGDRSNVGQLTTFGGKKLEKPITLDGGRGYSRGEGTGAWASDKKVVNALSRAVQGADGRPVYGTYMPMSGNATDFANMTREAVMSGFDPKSLPKKTAAEFNQRFLANKGVDETLRADFPGVASSELGAWFDKSGTRRASLFDFMDKAEWLKKGLPDVTEARFAIQDPHLRHVPSGVEQYGGQSVSLLEPSGKITPTSSLPMAHGTYNADLAGDYLGGFQQAIPRRVLFPDFYAARRAGGSSLATDNRAFQMKTVLQPTNAEWLDGVMKYLDTSPQQ